MPIITGTLRDVYKNATTGEAMLVVAHPKVEGRIIREHVNLRERDMRKACITGALRIGRGVKVAGQLSKYFSNGTWKTGLTEITHMEAV